MNRMQRTSTPTVMIEKPLSRRYALGAGVAAALAAVNVCSKMVIAQTHPVTPGTPAGPVVVPNGALDYRKVRALIVGVLQWRDRSLASFPQEGRKDRALVELLRSKGVPGANVVFLRDRQATKNAIELQFRRMLALTQPDETLMVYYAGHGGRIESGEGFFLPYDIRPGDLPGTGWSMRSVVQRLAQRPFQGKAIVAADCCYSGTLVKEATDLTSGQPIAVIASSLASVVSTSTWSFTECLIAGLEGRQVVDTDHNGRVTVQDLGRFSIAQMAFAEEQLASWTVCNGFDPNTMLASAPRETQSRIGERVEVLWSGTWYRAQIEGERGSTVRIHYIGYGRNWDEWAPLDRVRALAPSRQYTAGTAVEVEWHGVWYPARILNRTESVHLVHYDGYAESWDEWVGSTRVRVPQLPQGAGVGGVPETARLPSANPTAVRTRPAPIGVPTGGQLAPPSR